MRDALCRLKSSIVFEGVVAIMMVGALIVVATGCAPAGIGYAVSVLFPVVMKFLSMAEKNATPFLRSNMRQSESAEAEAFFQRFEKISLQIVDFAFDAVFVGLQAVPPWMWLKGAMLGPMFSTLPYIGLGVGLVLLLIPRWDLYSWLTRKYQPELRRLGEAVARDSRAPPVPGKPSGAPPLADASRREGAGAMPSAALQRSARP
ncbi:MAG: hypothetical protein EOO40_05565 [Deltaproteobacteria bacterium]|nr:MAG: hypothetical protein EOO40_05565 [Deltaproteobacteria bacterium]